MRNSSFSANAVAKFGLAGDDAGDLLGGEELALDVAEARRADRYDGVALELELGLCPLEKRHQDCAHFLPRSRSRIAPALVDEFADARRAVRRFEVSELEVGVVDRKL